MKTNATVSAVSHDVADTPTIVSGAKNNVVNAGVIVSDGHRNALKPEDRRGQNRMVSAIRALPVDE